MTAIELTSLFTSIITVVATVIILPVVGAYIKFRLDVIKIQNDRLEEQNRTGSVERAKNTKAIVEIQDNIATKEELEVVHLAVNSLNAEGIKETAKQARLQQEVAVSVATLEAEQAASKQKEATTLAAQVSADKWQVEREALIATKTNLEKQLLLKQQQEHPDRDPGLMKE